MACRRRHASSSSGMVIGSYESFHPIKHAGREAFHADEMLSDLQDSALRCHVVMARCNDQIGRPDQALLVNFVVVNEGTPWRFATTNPFKAVRARNRPNVLGKNLGII